MRQSKKCLSHFIYIEVLNKCYSLLFIMKSRPFRAQRAVSQKRRHCQRILLEQPAHQVLSRECSSLTPCWLSPPNSIMPLAQQMESRPPAQRSHCPLCQLTRPKAMLSQKRKPHLLSRWLPLSPPRTSSHLHFQLAKNETLFYPHPSTVTQSSGKEKASTFREQCF